MNQEDQIKRMLKFAEEISVCVWNADWFKEFWITKAKGEFDEDLLYQYFEKNSQKIEYWFGRCKQFAKDFHQLKPLDKMGQLWTDWWRNNSQIISNADISYKALADMKDLYKSCMGYPNENVHPNHWFANRDLFLAEQKEIRDELKQKEIAKRESERLVAVKPQKTNTNSKTKSKSKDDDEMER